MTCQQIESLLPPFVDGLSGAEDARRVSLHLASCDSCRRSMEAQRSVRAVLHARAVHLAPLAPPGLRTRVAALAASTPKGSAVSLGWRGRLSALGAAALVVLVIGSLLLPIATARSSVLLAAQLALDHLKCFVIDGDAGSAPITSEQASATVKALYGWSVDVPAAIESEGMTLVAVRRCLYGDGYAAHVLYRMHGEPVSLFIMPGLTHRAADLGVLGHAEITWLEGDKTYMLVSDLTKREPLQRVATQFQIEAK